MARTPKHTSSALVAKSPWSSLPLVGICGVLVAGCMFLGAPAAAENVTDDRDPVASVASEPSGSDSADDGMELIGSYEAISQSSNENRIENIRLASEAIDGTVIEPGETFSFNEAVGDTESDERYLEAPIISDDVTVNGRGGGICQVSTALYIAALKADLEIVERHSHTLVSDYAPIGLMPRFPMVSLTFASKIPVGIRLNLWCDRLVNRLRWRYRGSRFPKEHRSMPLRKLSSDTRLLLMRRRRESVSLKVRIMWPNRIACTMITA